MELDLASNLQINQIQVERANLFLRNILKLIIYLYLKNFHNLLNVKDFIEGLELNSIRM